MIVKCNACLVRYHLDDDVLGSKGRHVRCSSCKHVWYQNPPVPSPYMLVPVTQTQLAVVSPLEIKKAPVRFFWVGLALLLAGSFGVTGFVLYQKNLLWVPLQGWSALLKSKQGYDDEKIRIQNVLYRYTANSVICKVDFVNTSKELVYIPLLFIHIRKEAKILQNIRYFPQKTPLLPGEEKSLYMELKNVPEHFSDIVVRFSP